MDPIRRLDDYTINKIAAGEVVERPASVVKELVENSIDAQASAITVEIKDGGISLIRVTDNGIGIPKEDVTTALLRHTTSKITAVEDLDKIESLGFRGEALASIAAVSQLEIITKAYGEVTGKRVECYGGKIITEEEVGCPEGTTIIMRNLFYNIPARKKFLKKPATESSYISDMVYKIALGHPEVSFKFINNNSVVFHTSGNNELKNAVFNVYGKEVVKHMLSIEETEQDLKLIGLIGKPSLNRANRTYENFYINGRYIKSKILENAVEDAYNTLLPINKFPVVVLHIFIPANKIDVNVHPTKMEVRFKDEEEIYQFIYNGIHKNLFKEDLIPQVNLDNKKEKLFNPEPVQGRLPEPFEIKRKNLEYKDISIHPVFSPEDKYIKVKESNQELNFSHKENLYENKPCGTEKKEACTIFEKEKVHKEDKAPSFRHYKIIGQVFQTYWLVEQDNSLYIVDQHAAHERILYEKFIHDFKQGKVYSQPLLEPVVFEVTPKEKEIVEDNISLFKKFGFEIEEFGESAYLVRELPILFEGPVDSSFFLEIIDTLNDERIKNLYDMKLNHIALLSCKGAVKAKDQLSTVEAKALIEELLNLDNPFTCPHGRPTIISMSQYELEKKFKRVQ
ncbi:MAG TPA: DNA mismatch repair endonuclease MutL [Defluviitaleaceae bacterium]|nr:DNA mismatch repair endonuclease MutL [Defluviitaleaceae bacterium]HPT75304.1 DNA mismatch repair endonuclease MutL [Defluviitaleaceae bacterium]